MKKNENPLQRFMVRGKKMSLGPRHFVFLLICLLISMGAICPVHAVESAGNVTFNTNQVLGQNGDYPFAGIYVFDNLTIGDNVEITTTGISQLVIKVNGRLTLGRNAVIRVRNGFYPEAPVNLISSLNATNLQAKGVLTPEGIRVYENMFGRGGNGGFAFEDNDGAGGGGFGGGIGGGFYMTGQDEHAKGQDNGGNGGVYQMSGYANPSICAYLAGTGGGASDLGGSGVWGGHDQSVLCHDQYGGGGGNGGDRSNVTSGGGGGGYGAGVLTIVTNSILIVDSSAPPKFLVSGQQGGWGNKYDLASGSSNRRADSGQGGLLIIQNAGWNYPDGRSAKAARQNLWNLDASTYGTHTRPSTNGGHGIITGNPQKVFVNGMEIPYIEVTGISLDKTELNLTAGGDPGTLLETITPADATLKDVIWSIDKPEVASITTVEGIAYKIIEPLANGTATVTVTSVDGDFTARAMVYVGTVAKPSFSIGQGTYDSGQTVTITSSTAGASIRYTTDGTDPSATVGTMLANGSSVTISNSQTLKAIAYKAGLQDSEITSATYAINGSLKVNIGPSGLVPDARWRVDGGAWQTSGATVTGLTAGNHVVDFLDITGGWYKPDAKTVLAISGELTTVTANYSQTPPDTTPAAFTFIDQTGMALNTVVTSNTITVSGITAASPISITGGTYAINGGAYTSASGTVNNGDTVTVRQTSSSAYSSTTNAALTIGGVSDTFSVTTQASASQQALYAKFANAGIWQYSGSGMDWNQITTSHPQLLVTVGSTLYGTFEGLGIWKFDGTNWEQTTTSVPEIIVGTSSTLYGSFSGLGIWQWNGTQWSQTTPSIPQTIIASTSDLYGTFEGLGIWKWNGTSWSNLTTSIPDKMVTSGIKLYGAFSGLGIWLWTGTQWEQATSSNPQLIAASSAKLYGLFTGAGIWEWDGATIWKQISPDTPTQMTASGTELYAAFTGVGIKKWDGTTWSLISGNEPVKMVVGE